LKLSDPQCAMPLKTLPPKRKKLCFNVGFCMRRHRIPRQLAGGGEGVQPRLTPPGGWVTCELPLNTNQKGKEKSVPFSIIPSPHTQGWPKNSQSLQKEDTRHQSVTPSGGAPVSTCLVLGVGEGGVGGRGRGCGSMVDGRAGVGGEKRVRA